MKTQGERITFVKLINRNHKIQIPLIQRDYAQGRKSAKIVRDNFLVALHTYLSENIPNRDLDFVYGSIQNNNFVPLDGQQRLTTLFLLHWYLALKDDKKDDFHAVIVHEDKSKFTYETRTSSSDFCNALVNSDDVVLSSLIQGSIKLTIQDKKWYFASWNQDPTIDAMLNMLDAIHEKLKNTNGFYEKLVHPEQPILTFLFLNLDDLKLTDDLYIKMNSRGVPLTTFGNFKAKFEEYLESEQLEYKGKYDFKIPQTKIDTVQKYFSHKIDTDWLDLFWGLSTKSIKESKETIKDIGGKTDRRIMNFIRTLAINHCAALDKQTEVKFFFKTDIDNIHFYDYKDKDCLDETFIVNLITLLDLFRANDGSLQTYGVDNYFYDESKIFNSVTLNFEEETRYEKRIQFFAYCQYLIRWKTYEGLNDWMRVIVNLSENTAPYNSEIQFMRSIIAINELLPESNEILKYLVNNKPISGFIPKQIEEEIIKAKLILKSDRWSEVIRETEKQLEYFQSQITHLLSFSAIYEYHEENKNVDWNENNDDSYLKEFIKYRKKSLNLFDKNGLKHELIENHVFARTLLCLDNYLIQESNNISFLIQMDRDISWKRYLLGDKVDGTKKRNCFKELIDDNDFDVQNIKSSLEGIIHKKVQNINDWRKYFISEPKLFEDLGTKKYLRKISDTKIYLLRGERTSGSHSELDTRMYFFRHKLDKKEYLYHSISGESIEPYFGFTWTYDEFDYEIKIESNYDAQNFLLKFMIPKDWKNELIKEVLERHSLRKEEGEAYFKQLIEETHLLAKLSAFRTELNNLSPQNTL